MLNSLYLRLLTWARRQTLKRKARQRVAELEQRLLTHDQDATAMGHFPEAVKQRMQDYRDRLVKQTENAKRFT